MAETNTIRGDVRIIGTLALQAISLPAGTVKNAGVASDAAIEASKLEHQFSLDFAQVPGTAVVAETRDLHIVQGTTGETLAVEAAITGVIATGADRTVTIDVHRSTAAGAFGSILTAAITLNDGSTLRQKVAATIQTSALVAGDILRVIIAVAGSAGAQAQGLVVTTTVREDAD